MGAKILRTTDDGEVIYYKEDKIVKNMGSKKNPSCGYIYLPKGLVGKEITIKYNKFDEDEE